MRFSRRALPALLLCLPLLAACETGQALRPVPTQTSADLLASDPALAAQFESWTDVVPAYRIGEGDKLRIMFPRTPELEEEPLVRPDGVITLRATLGDVTVANMTTAEAADAIAVASTKRLRDPEVKIAVLDPVSARIYVGGEVKAPGAYRVIGPMSTVTALQLAGGMADTARINAVIQIRRSPDNKPMLRLLNVRGQLEGRNVPEGLVLSGDILFVPRSSISEVGLWETEFIERVVPFQRSFDYTLGHISGGSVGF